ncbi:hypothetical protein Pelo_17284 [Pelomyxa schiedti]|nr:hypothetical protein Pelo_17284 [Pelomyxa schiedti]
MLKNQRKSDPGSTRKYLLALGGTISTADGRPTRRCAAKASQIIGRFFEELSSAPAPIDSGSIGDDEGELSDLDGNGDLDESFHPGLSNSCEESLDSPDSLESPEPPPVTPKIEVTIPERSGESDIGDSSWDSEVLIGIIVNLLYPNLHIPARESSVGWVAKHVPNKSPHQCITKFAQMFEKRASSRHHPIKPAKPNEEDVIRGRAGTGLRMRCIRKLLKQTDAKRTPHDPLSSCDGNALNTEATLDQLDSVFSTARLSIKHPSPKLKSRVSPRPSLSDSEVVSPLTHNRDLLDAYVIRLTKGRQKVTIQNAKTKSVESVAIVPRKKRAPLNNVNEWVSSHQKRTSTDTEDLYCDYRDDDPIPHTPPEQSQHNQTSCDSPNSPPTPTAAASTTTSTTNMCNTLSAPTQPNQTPQDTESTNKASNE